MKNNKSEITLYYVIDPMCSWCWGFKPTWDAVLAKLLDKVTICYLMGGLATDNDQPMPLEMQQKLQDIWRKIQTTIPGTQFNFDYWEKCKPRRSTYPACRAVIAARDQGLASEQLMINAIQQAYYLEARNPSDVSTLIALATELQFDVDLFEADIFDDKTNITLLTEIQKRMEFAVLGFPSLVVNDGERTKLIEIEFGNSDFIVEQVLSCTLDVK